MELKDLHPRLEMDINNCRAKIFNPNEIYEDISSTFKYDDCEDVFEYLAYPIGYDEVELITITFENWICDTYLIYGNLCTKLDKEIASFMHENILRLRITPEANIVHTLNYIYDSVHDIYRINNKLKIKYNSSENTVDFRLRSFLNNYILFRESLIAQKKSRARSADLLQGLFKYYKTPERPESFLRLIKSQ